MQPKARFKRRALHVPNLNASCARLSDLYKASISQLIFMPGPAPVTMEWKPSHR